MKRSLLCLAALLLTVTAIESKPAGACPLNPTCNPAQCEQTCVTNGAFSGSCTGVCSHDCFCQF
jgi:hypothetical protein